MPDPGASGFIDQATKARLENARRNLQAGSGAGSVDLSGFQGFGTGRPGLLSEQETKFGGTTQQLFGDTSEEESNIVKQFLGTEVSAEQGQALSLQRRGALAGGLLGGAVESQVARQRQSFVAQNRAQGFDRVQQLVTGRLGRLQDLVGRFFSQSGGIQQLASIGGSGSIAAAAAGGGSEFAFPALQALEALGLGRAGQSFIAQATGQSLVGGQPLSDEEAKVARALGGFFSPNLSSEENQAIAEKQSRAAASFVPFGLGATAAIADSRAGRRLRNARAAAVAEKRSSAAATLQQAIGQRFGRLTAAAGQLQGLSAPLQALAQGGQGVDAIANLETSGFQNLFQTLGLL
jgi:hypothetical protein